MIQTANQTLVNRLFHVKSDMQYHYLPESKYYLGNRAQCLRQMRVVSHAFG